MTAPTFIRIRVSPAKAAINSARAIAGKQTGGLLPCQERSASHRLARSKYTFFTTEVSRSPSLPSRLAADARPQPSARNVRFGSWPCQNTSRSWQCGAAFLWLGLYSDRGHQRLDAHDVHYPSEIV